MFPSAVARILHAGIICVDTKFPYTIFLTKIYIQRLCKKKNVRKHLNVLQLELYHDVIATW